MSSPIWEPPEAVPQSVLEGLERIAPQSDRFAWLLPVWVAGDRWQPVNRWFVYQMLPRRHVLPFLLRDLEGPNPRSRGTFNRYLPEHSPRHYRPDPTCMIDRMQWLLWREHGALGRPYWVVQGEHGGHRRRLDYAEKVVRASRSGGWSSDAPAAAVASAIDVPAPGGLPYAGPDMRVVHKLAGFHKVEFYKLAIAAEDNDTEPWAADEQAETQKMRAELDKWLDTQIDGAMGDMGERELNRALDELDARSRPVEGVDWERSVEGQRRRMIELGI